MRPEDFSLAKRQRNQDMFELARRGAEARITELRREMDKLSKMFPGLLRSAERGIRRMRRAIEPASTRAGAGRSQTQNPTSRRRSWSAAQRRAAAERMRAYWAQRRAGKRK